MSNICLCAEKPSVSIATELVSTESVHQVYSSNILTAQKNQLLTH